MGRRTIRTKARSKNVENPTRSACALFCCSAACMRSCEGARLPWTLPRPSDSGPQLSCHPDSRRAQMVALACPICRTRPPRRACGNRVFASAHCPVCLETAEPVVALPCGHALCEGCFGRIPGGALLVDGQSVGAAARPTEDTRASEAQDRDATRQRHAEAEDAAARREAVERSRREAAEERAPARGGGSKG